MCETTTVAVSYNTDLGLHHFPLLLLFIHLATENDKFTRIPVFKKSNSEGFTRFPVQIGGAARCCEKTEIYQRLHRDLDQRSVQRR